MLTNWLTNCSYIDRIEAWIIQNVCDSVQCILLVAVSYTEKQINLKKIVAFKTAVLTVYLEGEKNCYVLESKCVRSNRYAQRKLVMK